jgi:hypothetical protein
MDHAWVMVQQDQVGRFLRHVNGAVHRHADIR